jgi:hypothetical protein
MAYVLEVGTFESVKMPYTYARRAQATVYRTVWRQVAIHPSKIDPLKEYAKRMAHPSLEFRIAGVGEHCQFEPQPFKVSLPTL